ncbi:hypothetical protein BDV37DRAFT_235080 [Aspergillus pseudonomiae]|uniref:Uncharacterized protein n=1 Tax=Aspergillus pseudonomiae TaxID=1506151 RepID=A0A5N7DTJ8_9EURO|nr:uncharacterized protein BDV37DRAFT_235080 [Aspergillus pseudonomiae]KAE8409772.1 hypothetical protein BDV37DRAFT_235080 [Aspergillus pseudonomiae]
MRRILAQCRLSSPRKTEYNNDIKKEFASLEHFWESFRYDNVVPGESVSIDSEIILMADKAFGRGRWTFWGSHEILSESSRRFREEGEEVEEWKFDVRCRMTVEQNGRRVDGFAENKSRKVVSARADSRQLCRQSAFRKVDDEALLNALQKLPTVSQALEGHNLRD